MINAIQGFRNNQQNYKKNNSPSFGNGKFQMEFSKEAGEAISNLAIAGQPKNNLVGALFGDFPALMKKVLGGKDEDTFTYKISNILTPKGKKPYLTGDLFIDRQGLKNGVPVNVGLIENANEQLAPHGYTFDASDIVTKSLRLSENVDEKIVL